MKHPFDYQAPNAGMVQDITRVREACKPLYDLLSSLSSKNSDAADPNPQAHLYFAQALLKLEEVSMHTNKGIVFSHGYADVA